MGERSGHPPGSFSWVELGSPDHEAAKAFYAAVFDWRLEDAPGEQPYTFCHVGDRVVGALFATDPAGGVPVWAHFVTVDDADASAERVAELGGTVETGPVDVSEDGRMAQVADPEGARLALWEARAHPGAALVNAPGALTWNELGTRDPEAAQRFYGDLFGWTFATDETGYTTILREGERAGGARVIGPEEGPTPAHWLPYFGVEDLEAALERVGEAGGQLLVPPRDIGPGRVAVVKDPQRAPFALYAGDYDP